MTRLTLILISTGLGLGLGCALVIATVTGLTYLSGGGQVVIDDPQSTLAAEFVIALLAGMFMFLAAIAAAIDYRRLK